MDTYTTFRKAALALKTMAIFAIAAPAHADTDTQQGSSQAEIVEPITVTKTTNLDFGKIVAHSTGIGRVRINARNGNRTHNANTSVLGTTGFSRALFDVTGEARRFVILSTSSNTITLTGPGTPMTVDRLRVSRNNRGQRSLPRRYRIPRSGSMEIGFGGRLNVPANQTPGIYTGTFDLTVIYE